MTDAFDDTLAPPLPPGVHPGDAATPMVPGFDSNRPVHPDTPSALAHRRRQPWSTENEEALGVFERAAVDWTPGLIQVGSVQNAIQVVGRQKGRTSAYLWIPTQVVWQGALLANPAAGAIVIGSDPNEAQLQLCCLNVGDAASLVSEASIYAALAPGSATMYLQFILFTNPVGGELGIH